MREKDWGIVAAFVVDRLGLTDFRNYASADVRLAAGFNLFAGQNGHGKTNLLEALFLLSTTRLLRGIRDHEAIREGTDRARVAATLGVGTEIAISLERGVRKAAFLNGLKLPRASDLLGRIPTVCISTEDLALARGEPADRRLFLDIELSQVFPSYLRDLSHYKRALEHRNALLKTSRTAHVSEAEFEPWEAQLATHGSAMRDARAKFVSGLNPLARRAHEFMGSGEELCLSYAPKDDSEGADGLRSRLVAQRPLDVERGATTAGPHRDDVSITVEGREARLFGSQGQQRTAVVAMKLATFELVRDELGGSPVLLLDDILSDLDEGRRARLVEWVLGRAGQALLTCTEAEAAGPEILASAKVFDVSQGTVTER